MSATDILNKLPKLNENERRLIRHRLLELESQTEDIDLCNQTALEGALMLDLMET